MVMQRRAAWGVGRRRHWKRILDGYRWEGRWFGYWAGRNEASGQPGHWPNPKWAMMEPD